MGRRTFAFLTDRRLIQRIRERIRWDKRVSTSDVRVIATNGRITLTGSLDSIARKRAVLEVVNNTEGVVSITDRIAHPDRFYRADSELKRLVEEQIAETGIGADEHISVAVADGHVKLEGVVRSPERKALAAGIVWELSGVCDCLNMIEIVPPPPTQTPRPPAGERRLRAESAS